MITIAASGPVPLIAIAGEARSAGAMQIFDHSRLVTLQQHVFEGLGTWSAELKRSSAISKTCVPSR